MRDLQAQHADYYYSLAWVEQIIFAWLEQQLR